VSIVEHILQDNGFDAVICTAVTYEAIDKSHCIYAGNLNGSSLVNGINLTSNLNGRKYFLTLDTPQSRHKEYMKGILNRHGVTIVFLNKDMATPR
jgi:hypothetical protein